MGSSLFEIKDESSNKCKVCNGTGMKLVKGQVTVCPECKGRSVNVISDDKEIDRRQRGVVPVEYKDIIFDKSKLLEDPLIDRDVIMSSDFNYYIDSMEGVYDKINIGEKLDFSLLFLAPQGHGKMSFVYSCLNAAIRSGFSVAPYYDSMEINDMMGAFTRENQERLEVLAEADICFIKIAHTNFVGAMRAFQIIVDRRARRGLPTIGISRFDLGYLYRIDSNLRNMFITGNYSPGVDYSRMRVVSSVFKRP